nr:putative reverse transcriptase domain-containing protein [Tanacetum cinerariifolium]
MQGNFSGTKGAVELTRWFEILESVSQVIKVADGDNVKYAACTMLDGALTWVESDHQRKCNFIKLADIHETITMAQSLMDQVVLDQGEKSIDNKRKWEGNHNNNYNQSKCQEVAIVYTDGPTDKGMYAGNLHHCNPLPDQQIRETKTSRGTRLPGMIVEKKDILRTSVQKHGTKAEETDYKATSTRTRETEMEETMVRKNKMETKLI